MLSMEPYIDGVYDDLRSSTKKVYKKVVNNRELELYKLAEKHGLCPKLIEVYDYKGIITITQEEQVIRINEHPYVLVNEYFPKTLYNYNSKDILSIFDKIGEVMKKLHSIGIAHLDSNPGNIVIDNDERVLLIDFGNSDYIKNITIQDAQEDSFNWNKKFNTVEELLAYEETSTYRDAFYDY